MQKNQNKSAQSMQHRVTAQRLFIYFFGLVVSLILFPYDRNTESGLECNANFGSTVCKMSLFVPGQKAQLRMQSEYLVKGLVLSVPI